MSLLFEWDGRKAASNLSKHKVSFDEAKTVFSDPFLLTFPDPYQSEDEERYLNIGRSTMGRVLVVVHTDRDERIRLISARKATTHERQTYDEGDFESYD